MPLVVCRMLTWKMAHLRACERVSESRAKSCRAILRLLAVANGTKPTEVNAVNAGHHLMITGRYDVRDRDGGHLVTYSSREDALKYIVLSGGTLVEGE